LSDIESHGIGTGPIARDRAGVQALGGS